ncbi:MAG: hypothetical protein AAB517_01900 [Patescibacteria group bacterium]
MNIFNTVVSSVKRFRSGAFRDPERDWIGMLAIAVTAFIGIVVWNIWTFQTAANGGVIGTATSSPATSLNRSSLDAIDAIFSNRSDEEAKYRTGVYRYSDPSQ